MKKITLGDIVSPHVITVNLNTPVNELLATMEERHISCVVAVDAAHRPLGIFTEQDAIRLMAELRPIAQLCMAEVMSAHPFSAPSDMDFRDAYHLIEAKGYRHILVTQTSGELMGVASEADFMHHLGMGYLVELKTVATSMTPVVYSLDTSKTLDDATKLMAQHKVSCVVIAEKNMPLGILTERDIVALARNVTEPAQVPITQVMKSPVQTVALDFPLQEAIKLMDRSKMRRLVVVKAGVIVGLITRHDIVKSIQGRYVEFLQEALERQHRDWVSTQNEIQQARQQLLAHSLMEQTLDAVFVIQPETGAILECNPAASTLLGYTHDELLRMTVSDMDASVTTPSDWHAERELTARDGKRLAETQYRHRDGGLIPVDVRAQVVARGEQHYIVAMVRDLSAHKKTQTQLRVQDVALNSTANAMVIANVEGVIEWANPAFTEMTGYALHETLGKRPQDLVRSGLQPREFYEALWNTILKGQVWRGELINKRKDGSHYVEEMTITPVYAEGKVITHFIAVTQDISVRKATESQLVQSEITYRGILDQVTEAVYVVDETGRIVYANQGTETMYGYSHEEMLQQQTGWTLLAPEKNDFAELRVKLQKLFAGEAQYMECWGVRKNGEIFPRSTNGVKGEYFGRAAAIIVARDITEQRLDEEKRSVREAHLTSLIENQPGLVWLKDTQGRLLMANALFAKTCEQPLDEIIGKTDIELWPREFAEKYRADDISVMQTGKPLVTQEQVMGQGEPTWFETFKLPVRDAVGKVIGTTGFSHNISERIVAEAQLREAAAVMANTHEGVVITDTTPRILAVNAAYTRITGYNEVEALGKNPNIVSSGRQTHDFYAAMWQQLGAQGYWQGEVWNRRKNGEVYPQLLTISTICDEQHQPIRYVGVFADISELKENQAKLEYIAHHDPLTQLPNRALVESRLAQELEQAHRHQQQLAVLFIDLDRFKAVNDSYGHLVGDELLCAVAARLNMRLREGDTLGRLGGDEFILLITNVKIPHDAAVVARDFINALSEAFVLSNGTEVFIGGSIGICLFPHDGASSTELMKNADAAMYLAKESGRNQFSFYTRALNADAQSKLMLENELRHAIFERRMVLHYQPQVDLHTGQICATEALIRWQKADGTLVSPAEFIPLAERSGLILSIGNWVIEQACMQLRLWLDEGLSDVTVAINVSARQFRSGNLDKLIAQALKKFKVSASHLEVEITESMLMNDPETAVITLQALKQLGVKLSLDDFGTGYSNFGYLSRFPIDTLKIDQSFVQRVTTDNDAAEITSAIIGLAHRMNLGVIAEGVETEAQLAFLRANDCDELQGYYFSKPLPAREFVALLRSGKTLPMEVIPTLTKRTLLIVEEDADTLREIKTSLHSDYYQILTATRPARALEMMTLHAVQVVLVDQHAPLVDALPLLQTIQQLHPCCVRILLVTQRNDMTKFNAAVNEGIADKLLTKPITDEQLRKHMRAAFAYQESIVNGQKN